VKITDAKAASHNRADRRIFVKCENCGGGVLLNRNGRPRVHSYCDRPDCRKAAAAARARASYHGLRLRPIDPPLPDHVRTVRGSNADLIAAVARLYVPDGALVADATWGRAAFWRRFNEHRRFTLVGSDIRHMTGARLVADFRCLPYAAASIDVLVLDPPYRHTGPNGDYLDHRYGGSATTLAHSHADIIELYRAGLVEARRVLRPNGYVFVKCQDEIESGRQRRSHIEIYAIAMQLGFEDTDFLIVVPNAIASRRWLKQHHAHKAHSYLWVFRK
jgi:hypothetical protein